MRFRPGKYGQVTCFGGYTLAAKRALGHTSATVTAQMVAGDEHQGGVQDAHTVLRFEHRMAMAKTLFFSAQQQKNTTCIAIISKVVAPTKP